LGLCCVIVMKLISWNIRGLGGFEKRRKVCQLVREKQQFILCIQETKLPVFDVTKLLVTIWDTKEVEVWSSMSFEHVLVIFED